MTISQSNERLHFPTIIGFSPKELKEVIDNIDKHYDEWELVKTDKTTSLPKTYSDGTIKKRFIRAAKSKLHIIQDRIKTRILAVIDLPDCVQGGVRGKSNISNAKKHQGNKYILTTDLKEFFPSATPNLVMRVLKEQGFNRQFCYYVSRFTTWKGELPQGVSTSTHLANLVFVRTDVKLLDICKRNQITYTRYVDDLTFSSQKDFQHVIPDILNIISKGGFMINWRKSHYRAYQTVTGIKVLLNKIDVSDAVLAKVEEERTLPDDQPKYRTNYRKLVLKTNQKSHKKTTASK